MITSIAGGVISGFVRYMAALPTRWAGVHAWKVSRVIQRKG